MKRPILKPSPYWYYGWVALLVILILSGLAAGVLVFYQGLWITNLSDFVPWGLWISIDLSSIALSAGAFLLSAAVYLLGIKELKPVARTAVFIGLLGYSMALMTLLLDIGRPDRFWHSLAFWNVHSPLWEVTMCIALYFSVLMLEVAPIFGQADWFQARWPRLGDRLESIHKLAPFLAILGLGLSMLHQSSLGATYGVLKARPVLYRPSMAVMFMVTAMAAGPALTVLASKIAAYVSSRATVNDEVLGKVTRFIGWVLVALLYMRVWDFLAMHYTYEPGRNEGLHMLTSGPLAFNFWVGEIALGIVVPMILLLNSRLRRHERLQMLALLLVVGGLVAHRWDTNIVSQLVVFNYVPQQIVPTYTHYVPSLVEIMAGLGVISYGVLAFTLGVRYLRIVDHPPETAVVPAQQTTPVSAPAVGD